MNQQEIQFLDANGSPLNQKMEGSHYSASKSAKEFANWNPVLSSGDSESLYERETLVARGRDLTRNNGIAHGLKQTYNDNIIGNLLRLVPKPDYKLLGMSKEEADEWSHDCAAKFRGWADTVEVDAARRNNLHGLANLALFSAMDGGEALALPLWMKDRRVRTVIQMVDPDRLATPIGQKDSDVMRDGVEINRFGEPKFYNIRSHHPGDTYLGMTMFPSFQKIPARTRFGRLRVIHAVDQKRIGQHRGKHTLTSIMGKFKMLDHYERYELKSAIVNSLIAAFIETSMSNEEIANLFNADYKELETKRAEWNANLEGGALIPLFPGDKLTSFTPSRPATAYSSFTETLLRHMATGANIPYELLLKDFSKTNYSSARAAMLEAWRFFLGRRKWLVDYFLSPIYDLWLEEQVNRNLISAPSFYENRAAWTRCRWICGGRGWVDPEKEAKSQKLRMQNRTSTLEDECAEQGKDWMEVLEQQATEQQYAESIGLDISDLFTEKSSSPAVAGEDNPEDSDTEEESGDDNEEVDPDNDSGEENDE